MKKLFLSLLTLATAATAVTGIAACSLGQTGGGDTATRNAKNISVTESQDEEQPDMQAPDEKETDGGFEFLPPDNMAQGEPMPLPLPPQGRIFAPHVRHPEILHDAPMAGTAKEGTEEISPKSKLPKRKDGRKGDMVTPDGNIMPQVQDAGVKPGGNSSCPDGCPENGGMQEEQPAPEKSATDKSAAGTSDSGKPTPESKRPKHKKGKHNKPDAKEKNGVNNYDKTE